MYQCFVSFWRDSPQWAMASSFTTFLYHTQRRTTVGRTPLDEWSARRRDLYLTTHNTHNRQTSMPPVGFEPTVSVGERPLTYSLDRAATGTGKNMTINCQYFTFCVFLFCTIVLVFSTWTLTAVFCATSFSSSYTSEIYAIIKGKVFPLQARCAPEGGVEV